MFTVGTQPFYLPWGASTWQVDLQFASGIGLESYATSYPFELSGIKGFCTTTVVIGTQFMKTLKSAVDLVAWASELCQQASSQELHVTPIS